jgi:hypothetical protein
MVMTEEDRDAIVDRLISLETEVTLLRKRNRSRQIAMFCAQVCILACVIFGTYSQTQLTKPLREISKNLAEIQQKLDRILELERMPAAAKRYM